MKLGSLLGSGLVSLLVSACASKDVDAQGGVAPSWQALGTVAPAGRADAPDPVGITYVELDRREEQQRSAVLTGAILVLPPDGHPARARLRTDVHRRAP